MSLPDMDFQELNDVDFAVYVANVAGQHLVQLQAQALASGIAESQLKANGDAQSQRLINSILRTGRAEDAVLSEEADDDGARLTANRVWIIDPLDGTREFAEGRSDWAVHVALWEKGSLSVGAVALPGIGELYHSRMARNQGRPDSRPLKLAISRTRPSPLTTAVADHFDAETVPMGSAGYKIGAVIRGEVDAYLHSGGQFEWDSAAPVAVAMHLGLHASRIDGSPLQYNQADPYLPDLLVCRAELAPALLSRIQEFRSPEFKR